MRLATAAALALGAAAAALFLLDRPIAQLVLRHAGDAGEIAMLVSAAGSPFLVLPLLLVLAALEQAKHIVERCAVFVSPSFQPARRLFIGAAAAIMAALLLKPVIGRARPPADAFDHLFFQPFGFEDAFGSFPSAQAAMAGALAAGLSLCFPRQRVLAVAAATIICLAPVVAGDHWLSDAIVGASLGAMIGYTAFSTARKPEPEYYL